MLPAVEKKVVQQLSRIEEMAELESERERGWEAVL